jgi:hypothetical protein
LLTVICGPDILILLKRTGSEQPAAPVAATGPGAGT